MEKQIFEVWFGGCGPEYFVAASESAARRQAKKKYPQKNMKIIAVIPRKP